MHSFSSFLSLLSNVADPRRREGKLYTLQYVLLFSILAIVAGADSYRSVHTFIETHLARLNAAFGLSWKRAPAYTAIRYILRRLDPASIEAAFRKHAGLLQSARDKLEAAGGGQGETGPSIIAIDGKTLKHSFDNFNDRKAAHILNAFAADSALILAHTEVDDKSNEIPAAQKLMAELNLTGRIVTLDAMHCQKNFRSRRQGGRSFDRPDQGQSAQPA
jgi:hypothetical protein